MTNERMTAAEMAWARDAVGAMLREMAWQLRLQARGRRIAARRLARAAR